MIYKAACALSRDSFGKLRRALSNDRSAGFFDIACSHSSKRLSLVNNWFNAS